MSRSHAPLSPTTQLLRAIQHLKVADVTTPKGLELDILDVDTLIRLDTEKILAKNSKDSLRGSFARQEQYSPEQRMLTEKLECLAAHLENPCLNEITQENYLEVLEKLQFLLKTYIEDKQETPAAKDLKRAANYLSQTLPPAMKLTSAEIKLLANLDSSKILHLPPGLSRPSSFTNLADQAQDPNVRLIASKLRQLAYLAHTSPAATQDKYASLIPKLTGMLTEQMKRQVEEEKKQGSEIKMRTVFSR